MHEIRIHSLLLKAPGTICQVSGQESNQILVDDNPKMKMFVSLHLKVVYFIWLKSKIDETLRDRLWDCVDLSSLYFPPTLVHHLCSPYTYRDKLYLIGC